MKSGDYLRRDFRFQLGELLNQGVPVTLAYGDRDYAANCLLPVTSFCRHISWSRKR